MINSSGEIESPGTLEEIGRLRRELASYKLSAARVGNQLARISRLHQELDRSQRETELILETTSDAMRLVDRDYNIIWANRAMGELTGQTSPNLNMEKCHQVIKTPRCGTAECILRSILKDGRQVVVEEEVEIAGEKRQCLITSSPFRNRAGEITGILEDFIDITERKRMEKAVKDSEQFLQDVLTSIQDGVSVLNPDLTVRHTNAVMEEWYRASSPLKGKKCYQAYHNKNIPCDPCPTLRCLESGKTESEIVPGFPGSPIKWIELFSFPMKDTATGKLTGVVEYVRDITERKKVGEALHESERMLKDSSDTLEALFNALPDVIGLQDNEHRIIRYNAAGYKFLGVNPEDVVGRRCYELIGRNVPCEICASSETYKTKKVARVEKYISELDIWLDVRAYPILDEDGEIASVIEHLRDITLQKKMEEELLRSRKLESLGILAGGIAHDFNNILTAVMGNISLLKLDARPGSETYQSLDQAEAGCIRAKGLTQQLLTFSSGGAPVKAPVMLGGMLSEAAIFVLHGSNVSCRFSIPDDLWPVEADEVQIGQVINNLVINADQAMAEGGEMNIKAENVTLEADELPLLAPGRYIVIEIEDRGTGIPAKHLDKIFDPYFTTKQKGSGLGLATAYSIVEKHGGVIKVQSLMGEGTIFSIYLPALDQKIMRNVRPREEIKKGKGRVLLMDDEESVRVTAEAMLKKLGYEVETAFDGTDVVNKYRSALETGAPFDVVILDLTIPGGKGGREALARLKNIDPAVKAIVSSGYSSDPVMAEYSEAGFMGVVSKPYSLQELSQVLGTVLED